MPNKRAVSSEMTGGMMIFKKKNKNNLKQEKRQVESDAGSLRMNAEEEEATVFVGSCEDEDRTCFLWETNEREGVIRLTDAMYPEKVFTAKVDDSVIIGHSASLSDICVDHDRAISRKHCRLIRRGNEYFLHDLESSNGTFVNGSRIYSEEKAIFDGDLIRIGRVELKFETGR